MTKISEILKKISGSELAISKIEDLKTDEDVYRFFAENGFEGDFAQFKKEMLKATDFACLSDEDLELISGGVMGRNTSRFVSALLAALVMPVSTNLGSVSAAEEQSGVGSTLNANCLGSGDNSEYIDIKLPEVAENIISKIDEEVKEEINSLGKSDTLKKGQVSEKLKKAIEISCAMSKDSYDARLENQYDTPEIKKEAQEAMNRLEGKGYTIFGNYYGVPGGVMKVHEICGKNYLVVAFHGTNDTNDVIADLIYKKERCDFLEGKGVHIGMFDRFDALCRRKISKKSYGAGKKTERVGNCEEEIQKIIKSGVNLNGGVILTGHSLGGALATLMALYLSRYSAELKGRINLVTFCSPRVLSPEAYNIAKKLLPEQYENDKKPFTVRIWRKGDIVSKMPYESQGFKHFGKSWCINKSPFKERSTRLLYILSWFSFNDWYNYFNFRKYHSVDVMSDDIKNLDSLLSGGKIKVINKA